MASKPSGSKPGKKPPKGSGTPQTPKAPTSPGAPSGSSPTSSSKPSRSSSSSPRRTRGQQAGADVSLIASAVGLGFLILIFGGLLQPVATTFIPQAVSQFWVIFVAVVAFASAGVRTGLSAPKPALYGAGTAVGSYLLVVPVQFLQASFNPLYAVFTLIGAAVIGAGAALLGTRFSRSDES